MIDLRGKHQVQMKDQTDLWSVLSERGTIYNYIKKKKVWIKIIQKDSCGQQRQQRDAPKAKTQKQYNRARLSCKRLKVNICVGVSVSVSLSLEQAEARN